MMVLDEVSFRSLNYGKWGTGEELLSFGTGLDASGDGSVGFALLLRFSLLVMGSWGLDRWGEEARVKNPPS